MNVRWLLLTLLVSSIATCGQKGPLELPDTAAAAPSSAVFTPQPG
jgi:predicted small lipoprotein YifL